MRNRGWEVVAGLDVAAAAGRLQRLDLAAGAEGELGIVWLGHASFLIRWKGVTLVIDPVFRRWLGVFPRVLPLPRLEGLGRVDAALISHGHMDHLDGASLRAVESERIVIPSKTSDFLGKDLRGKCERVEIGQELEIGPLRVSVVAARHGGWRYPWQRGYFACGFVLSDGERTVYAAGDTAYGPHLAEIGKRWRIDTALLPIGAYAPQWFLKRRHLNPEEACRAALDLEAGEVVPFHFGTYRLSWEALDEPMRRFVVAAEEAGLEWRVPLGLG